jgi:SAM-dependent MidA family methyltransferase
VRQAVRHADGWHERCVGLDGRGRFVFTESAACIALADLPDAVANAPAGAVFEWRDPAAARALGARVAQGGAALAIDYGHTLSGVGDTLQALGAHAYTDPLEDPGERDLTAHVDFDALIRDVTSGGAVAFGPLGQGDFLRRLGIETRAEKLAAGATPKQRADIDAALARLTGSGRNEMGRLFKAVAFAHPHLGPLPGFD